MYFCAINVKTYNIMNKKLSFYLIALTAIGSTLFGAKLTSGDLSAVSFLDKTDIESLTNCEAIDGHKNDGHCTHDDYANYFCESPGFLQSKNCRQR